MSAGLHLTSILTSSAQPVIPPVPPQSFNPTAMSPLEGRAVVRSPQQLRPHPALDELGWSGVDELNNTARLKNQSAIEPILITTNGTILAGFGIWQAEAFYGRREIHCIEYPLGKDESLQFILTYHQSRRGWNDFVTHLSR